MIKPLQAWRRWRLMRMMSDYDLLVIVARSVIDRKKELPLDVAEEIKRAFAGFYITKRGWK